MYVIFFILIYTNMMQCKIVIKDSGVSALHKEDVGILFYITLENVHEIEYNVSTRMIECCLRITSNETDCQVIQLLGNEMDVLFPKSTKNVSLIYPNMYPFNTVGNCRVTVKYLDPTRGGNVKKIVKIDFDTRIKGLKNCSSVDLDPLDSCEPVNCQMKYVGYRNYFNRIWNRCQKVPICIYDEEKELPDVAYVPLSNVCRDLESGVCDKDLKIMDKGTIDNKSTGIDLNSLSVNIRCHHGKLDPMGFCVCNKGWMSAPIDKMQYEPSLSLIHMCTIEVSSWKTFTDYKTRKTALLVTLMAILGTIGILLIAFCLHLMHKCIKSVEEKEFAAMRAANRLHQEEDEDQDAFIDDRTGDNVPLTVSANNH